MDRLAHREPRSSSVVGAQEETQVKEGVWIAFHYDLSALAVFNAYEELEARRYAAEHYMNVEFVEFGKDIREQLLAKR